MKRFFALTLIAVFILVGTGIATAAEKYAPGQANTGNIGTTSKPWQYGYFQYLPGFRVEIASKDWGTASGEWTLSATEQRAALIYVRNAGGATSIVAPSETGRVYTVFNNSGQNVTIKKSGGVGITIANGKVATVMYFQSNASTDYMRVTADATF
jgi:hypothetical protein